MKDKRKPYMAPQAERILLAPLEDLATSDDDVFALNKWEKTVIQNASITGGNAMYWGEDGTIKHP